MRDILLIHCQCNIDLIIRRLKDKSVTYNNKKSHVDSICNSFYIYLTKKIIYMGTQNNFKVTLAMN